VDTSIIPKIGIENEIESSIRKIEKLDPEIEDYQFTRNENSYKKQL
jgi:hypothetical protein